MAKVYPFGRIMMAPFYRLWCKKVGGTENLPKPPFIIASNHVSYYETMLYHCTVALKLNTRIHALVDGSYWKYTLPRIVLDSTGQIPIDISKTPQAKKNNQNALRKANEYLKKGEIVLVFPEGGRSKLGDLKKAKPGIAKLALMSKVPIVPFGVIGAEKVLPKGETLPRFSRCEVNIGKPITFKKYYKKKALEKDLEKIVKRIMKEVAKLAGKEYNY